MSFEKRKKGHVITSPLVGGKGKGYNNLQLNRAVPHLCLITIAAASEGGIG